MVKSYIMSTTLIHHLLQYDSQLSSDAHAANFHRMCVWDFTGEGSRALIGEGGYCGLITPGACGVISSTKISKNRCATWSKVTTNVCFKSLIGRSTSTTNRAISRATPIDHTYQCHAARAQSWVGYRVALRIYRSVPRIRPPRI